MKITLGCNLLANSESYRDLELFWQEKGGGRQLNLLNSFMGKDIELQNRVERCIEVRTACLFPLKSAVLPVLTLLEFLALPSQVFHCLMMTRTLARAASFASWLLADSRCVASFNGSTLPCPKSPQSWTVLSEGVPWLPQIWLQGWQARRKQLSQDLITMYVSYLAGH